MECFDGERMCCRCKRKEAWQSCRDCVPIRDFCEECFEEHHRGMKPHTVIGLIRHPRPLPKCKRHMERLLDLVCSKCNASLCVECMHDKSMSCPSTGRHETELAATVAKVKRDDISQALGAAFSQKISYEGYLRTVDQVKEDLAKQEVQAEKDLKSNYSCLQQKRGDHFKAARETLEEHGEQVRGRLDTIQQRSAEAQTLLSRSSDVEICEQASSLVSELIVPIDFTLPTLPSITVGSNTAPVGGLVEAGLSSLVITSPVQAPSAEPTTASATDRTSATPATAPADTELTIIRTAGHRLKLYDELWVPAGRCTVDTSVGPVVVEAFGDDGLYSTGPDGERVKVIEDGVEHYGVCTGMDDGRVVYSTAWKKNTITMYVTMNGKLVRISEVSVKGAKGLTRIGAGPTTGKLVVVDQLIPRLTIHSPDCTLLRCIGPTLPGGDIILMKPSCAAWSQCEKYLYASDWMTGEEKDERVLKLSLTDPPQLMWQTPLVGELPFLISHIGQCVYITHSIRVKPKVTVLSEEDGSVLKVISCPGAVKEMKPTAHGELELVYYSQ